MIQLELFEDGIRKLVSLGSEFSLSGGTLRAGNSGSQEIPGSQESSGSSPEGSSSGENPEAGPLQLELFNSGTRVLVSLGPEFSLTSGVLRVAGGPGSSGTGESGSGSGETSGSGGSGGETGTGGGSESSGGGGSGGYQMRPLSETLSRAIPPMPRPGYNEPFDDPAFGSRVVRITDDSDSGWIHRTGLEAISLDETKIHLMKRGGAGESVVLDFDPVNMRVLGYVAPALFPQPDTWMYTRNTLFKIEGKRLREWDPATKVWTTLVDWSPVLPSNVTGLVYRRHDVQDRRFCCQFSTTEGAYRGLCVLDVNGELVYFLDDPGAKPDMDQTGRYVKSVGGRSLFIDLEAPGGPAILATSFPGEWPWHQGWGRGFDFGPDGIRHDFRRMDLDTQKTYIIVPQPPTPDWSHGVHFTTVIENGQWVVGSQFRTKMDVVLQQFDQEVFMISTDGSQPTKRIAHHRSLISGDYYNLPRAVGSFRGNLVLWDSDWADDPVRRRDVYVARVP